MENSYSQANEMVLICLSDLILRAAPLYIRSTKTQIFREKLLLYQIQNHYNSEYSTSIDFIMFICLCLISVW